MTEAPRRGGASLVRRAGMPSSPRSGSGEEAGNRWSNLEKLRPGDEVKIVIKDRADFDWALARIDEHRLRGRVPLLLAPVQGALEPAVLARWILDAGIDARLNLQLHTQLWGDARGV